MLKVKGCHVRRFTDISLCIVVCGHMGIFGCSTSSGHWKKKKNNCPGATLPVWYPGLTHHLVHNTSMVGAHRNVPVLPAGGNQYGAGPKPNEAY